MSVYAPTTDYIWELVKSRGIDPAPIFTKAGLDPGTRRNTNSRVPRKRFDHLIELAAEACNDPAFGLRATARFHPSHFGALGYSWLTSSTLRSALKKFIQYSKLVTGRSGIELREEYPDAIIELSWPDEMQTDQISQIAMALIVHMCRLILDADFNPTRVDFMEDPPADRAPFDDHFRCPVYFDAGSCQIVIPIKLLDKPLPRSHPELSRVHDEAITRYLAQRDKADIISQCKAAIFELIAGHGATAEQVANYLNMSSRTLNRRLVEQGTSFRKLLNRQRRELALKYIQDESLSLTEISYLLGFAEPSSFSRAFKGWTGQTPTESRSAGVE